MVNIVISGLPKNVKIPKFINYLEKAVFRDVVDARLLHTMHVDGNVKNITLSMRSNDARRARRFLHGLLYQYAGKEYPLECWQNDTENSRQTRDRNDMDYPDSPTDKHYLNDVEPSENPSSLRRELEEIDLKIEIVKRQRILLEEENKLLMEQKKSEMLRKIGPNDYENLVKFEKVCGLKNSNDIAKVSPPSTTNAKKKNSNKLPSFNAPCKIIIKEMNQVLSDHVKPENRDMIMSLIYSAIRKRLILVLQGKSFMPAPDIVHLYRLKYPQNTDMKLLEELMDTVSQSFWPKKQSDNPNDNEGSNEVKTKNEETDVVIIKKDENEDTENNDDVQIITENDVEIVKVDSNDQNNDEKVETKQESENNKCEVETSVNEKTISSIENVEVVDMDNDFDEWVENDSKEEKEVENKELEL
ncbi:unnamed protein product [Euphydryas editha]|uniref:Uncharacterized protein n=1 Tax=Euphydryas editha TaxID=104508 RepID=A0AAU9ULM2_EUPED|nr:unnamed protein product [Euphydryas editha]